MADDTEHSDTDDLEPSAPESSAPEPTSRRAPGGGAYASVGRAERRRVLMRRMGGAMIVLAILGAIGIVLYFVGTWLYTSRQQDALREQLEAANPGLAVAEASVSEEDYVTLEALVEGVGGIAALAAAEAERIAELAALKAAADEYQREIRGHVGKAIGRIIIPSIGLDSIVVEGDFQGFSESYLRKGPGHWPETPIPGQGGSVVLSGHRSTYGAPFRKLNELKAGDEIELVMPYAIIRYKITQVIIVAPDEVQMVQDQGKEQVSLVACHPIYSASERIIAQGDLSSFVLLGAEQ